MADTLHQLSRVLATLDERRAALDIAEEASTLAPEPSAALLRDLAFAYHVNGDDTKAAEIVDRAIERLDEERGSEVETLRKTLAADRGCYR